MFKRYQQIGKDTPDVELMLLSGKGNRAAFELLYERYFRKLVGFCKRLLGGDEALAEDVVQEVFIKLIDRPEQFDTTKVFSTWIYTLAKNRCFNQLRNEDNRKQLLDTNYHFEEAYETHSTTDANLLKKKIAELFNSLNEKEKLLFVLRFEQELPIKEIAVIADIPVGSVKSGIFYLLKKIDLNIKEYELR